MRYYINKLKAPAGTFKHVRSSVSVVPVNMSAGCVWVKTVFSFTPRGRGSMLKFMKDFPHMNLCLQICRTIANTAERLKAQTLSFDLWLFVFEPFFSSSFWSGSGLVLQNYKKYCTRWSCLNVKIYCKWVYLFSSFMKNNAFEICKSVFEKGIVWHSL